MEYLEVHNFLLIKEASIEIKDINFIIGPQATGKSIISKLIYFFRTILSAYFPYSIQALSTKRILSRNALLQFEEIFPRYTWGTQVFSIEYRANSTLSISVKRERNKKGSLTLKFDYSNELANLHRKSKNYLKRRIEKIDKNLEINQRELSTRLMIDEYLDGTDFKEIFQKVIFIPSGRSFFANLQRNVFTFLSNNIDIDPLLKQFGSSYENIKRYYTAVLMDEDAEPDDKKLRMKVKSLGEKILSGQYFYDDEEDWIVSPDNRRTNLANASSGQQESVPMLVILSIWPFILEESLTFFIEEPEAHLFPSAQKYISTLVALLYRRKNAKFIITTHSPYIITAINNMILSANIYEEKGEVILSRLNTIIDPDIFISSDSVAAYTIEDGILKNIIDKETRLIGQNIIDSVSDEFEAEFDDLIALTLED